MGRGPATRRTWGSYTPIVSLRLINLKLRWDLPSGVDPSWRAGEPCRVPRRYRCRGYRSDRSRRTRLWPRAARTTHARESPSTGHTDLAPTISSICLPGSFRTRWQPGLDECPGKRRSTVGPHRHAPSSSCSGPANFHSLRQKSIRNLIRTVHKTLKKLIGI